MSTASPALVDLDRVAVVLNLNARHVGQWARSIVEVDVVSWHGRAEGRV